jgi:RimJ/RimL family protein N-acetyltransferase
MTRPWEAPPTGQAAALAASLTAAIPALRTPRLSLRAPRIGDFTAYAEITMSDRAKGIGGPFSREEAWLDFTQAVAGWLLRGFGLWTLEVAGDGAVAGFVLLNHEFGDEEPELGFLLLEAYEARGLAQEAAEAARAFAFGELGWASVVSYIDADNHRSRRLAERMGARHEADAQGVCVYRHEKGRMQ